jgi:hypothetical protein
LISALDVEQDALAYHVTKTPQTYIDPATLMLCGAHCLFENTAFIESPNIDGTIDFRALAVAQKIVERARGAQPLNGDLFLNAVNKAKLSFMPFSACFAYAADEQLETRLNECGIDLKQADMTMIGHQDSQRKRERGLEYLITRDIAGSVTGDAGARFAKQLSSTRSANRPHRNLLSVLQDMQRAAKQSGNAIGDVRLVAEPSLQSDFSGALAKMLGANPSTERIRQALDKADNRSRLSPVLSSTFLAAPGKISLRFTLPARAAALYVRNPMQEAQGIFTFDLNGRHYQTDVYDFEPRLQLLEDVRRQTEELPECREERALEQGKKACEQTRQTQDENHQLGRRIDHSDRFIQEEPVWSTAERPRRGKHCHCRSSHAARIDFRQSAKRLPVQQPASR